MWLWLLQWFLGIVLAIVISLYALFKYYTGNKGYWPKNNVFFVDIDKEFPFWDRMSFKIPFHIMEKNLYQLFKSKGCKTFGGLMEFRKPVVILTDLDLIKAVTVKDFDHFVDRRKFNPAGTDPATHDMLLNKEGQEWRDLRSTLSPAFSTGKLKRMFQVFNECAEKLVNYLEEVSANAPPGDGVDIRDGMTRFTLDVIASVAFGVESQCFKDKNAPFSTMVRRLQKPFEGIKFLKVLIAVFAPKLLDVLHIKLSDQGAMDFYTNALQETIRRREQSGEKRNDLVQLLIDAKTQELKPEGEEGDVSLDSHEKNSQVKKARKTPMTDKLILSQALLFFFAGFDTMETLLMFAIYELALNQDVQEKLFQEIDKSIEASGGELEYEAVNRMEYLDKVISETLRKYPPAVRTERQCTIDYKFPNSDYELKKGSLVIVPLYGIHYDEEYFPEPERFDPERFSPEVKAKRHPYAYMPFGTGPRSCIAMRFALIEGKAAVARLIHKFKIEPSQKTEIPVKVGRITGFKPDGGMYLNLKRRIEE